MKLALAATILVLLSGCATTTAPSLSPTPGSLAGDADMTPTASALALNAVGPERLAPAAPPRRPEQPTLAARLAPALVGDHCTDRDLAAPAATDVALTILDRSYGLPASYAPDDLVAAAEAGLRGASATKLVRTVILDDLSAMRAALEAQGLSITIESAYRSYASQAATFDLWAARIGDVAAMLRSARPGHSEHQLGTAIDVTSPGWNGRVGDWAAESAEGAWMAEHAWEYGFVMSYPSGSQVETCFGYEPWHYRWIGRDAAAAHRRSGLFLREFLERYASGD
jgi:D-alanyl-D-alanine carboxypeptidase